MADLVGMPCADVHKGHGVYIIDTISLRFPKRLAVACAGHDRLANILERIGWHELCLQTTYHYALEMETPYMLVLHVEIAECSTPRCFCWRQ